MTTQNDLLKKVKIQNKVQANDTILYCYDSGSFDGLLIKTECKYKIKCKDEYNDNEWKEIEIKSNEFQEIPIQIGEIQIEFDDRTIVHLYLRSQGCM